MKKYIYLLFVIIATSTTSCLKSNLEELPAFEENDITGVDRVEYRYVSDELSKASNQPIVKYVNLNITKKEIDKTAKTVKIEVKVPAANTAFSAAEREKVAKSNLAVIVSVSTAARVFPVGNAPRLGVPGNWENAHQYSVEAANGNTAQWSIQITTLTK
jgi:hypothetical protein